MAETTSTKGRQQLIVGVVVSDKMNKTRVLEIKHTRRHSLYHKNLIRRSHLFVHDEKNESHMGDLVEVSSTRPTSKNKSFRLVRIVEKQVSE